MKFPFKCVLHNFACFVHRGLARYEKQVASPHTGAEWKVGCWCVWIFGIGDRDHEWESFNFVACARQGRSKLGPRSKSPAHWAKCAHLIVRPVELIPISAAKRSRTEGALNNSRCRKPRVCWNKYPMPLPGFATLAIAGFGAAENGQNAGRPLILRFPRVG